MSIVTFFAVPPGILDRDLDSLDEDTASFVALFKRFIDMPATESDRLAAWGIHCADSNGTAGTAAGEDLADSQSERESESSGHGGGIAHSSAEATGAHATSSSSSSGWKIPSDISWPDPRELGALPQDDFRNMRFKLVPLVTEGPWIM